MDVLYWGWVDGRWRVEHTRLSGDVSWDEIWEDVEEDKIWEGVEEDEM